MRYTVSLGLKTVVVVWSNRHKLLTRPVPERVDVSVAAGLKNRGIELIVDIMDSEAMKNHVEFL